MRWCRRHERENALAGAVEEEDAPTDAAEPLSGPRPWREWVSPTHLGPDDGSECGVVGGYVPHPLLTSTKGFGNRGWILGDDIMAAARLARLLHRCHAVALCGNSYRQGVPRPSSSDSGHLRWPLTGGVDSRSFD